MTYDDNTSKFETAANGGVMPWWESTMTASKFAAAVGSSLGEPNIRNDSTRSPIFAYRFDTGIISGRYWSVNGRGGIYQFGTISSESLVWAQATLYAPPAPAPLPLLGAGAAFGFSRKLRKRIQVARKPLA